MEPDAMTRRLCAGLAVLERHRYWLSCMLFSSSAPTPKDCFKDFHKLSRILVNRDMLPETKQLFAQELEAAAPGAYLLLICPCKQGMLLGCSGMSD